MFTSTYCDQVYIISLPDSDRRPRVHQQMRWIGEENYRIVDAIDGRSLSYAPDYAKATRRMTSDFIRYNFPRGAFGCLLSHIKVIEMAIAENHGTILVLEDDFLLSHALEREMKTLMNNLPHDWEFVYLGKKQGSISNLMQQGYWYPPNDMTWSSHAWLIRRSMYGPLLSCYRRLTKPVDLAVMDLFSSHRFCVSTSDIVITTLSSQIWVEDDTPMKSQPWNDVWTLTSGSYYNPTESFYKSFRKIIVWGFTKDNLSDGYCHTHSYIHEMIFDSFSRAYPDIPVEWVDDKPMHSGEAEHCLFFASPCHGSTDHLPLSTKNSWYIFHLDTFEDNLGISTGDFLNKQEVMDLRHRSVVLLCRERIPGYEMEYFQEDVKNRMICLPWGFSTVENLKSPEKCWESNIMNRFILYQGSVWYLNRDVIMELVTACEERNMSCLISGRIKEEIPHKGPFVIVDDIHERGCTADEYIGLSQRHEGGIRMWLPVQGSQHFNTYVSDRIFKSMQAGFLGVTNNPLAKRLFPSLVYRENVSGLIDAVNDLMKDRDGFCSLMRRQRDEVLSRHDGVERVRTMVGFLESCLLTTVC